MTIAQQISALYPTRKLACVYARFSTDGQKATSIADQVRNCKALAEARGYKVPEHLIFTDEAVSGNWERLGDRKGYQALLDAWGRGEFDAIVADEVSRLARDKLEAAVLERRVVQSKVHLFTLEGTDSTRAGWTLEFSIRALLSAQALEEYAHRTRRGMLGTVLRGYHVGAAPFGYRAVKRVEGAEVLGTLFEVDPDTSPWVVRAYTMRAAGQSLNSIAEHFNQNGAPLRSSTYTKGRCEAAGYWRAAQVRSVLDNPLYAGYLLYPVKDEVTGRVTLTRFEREHLRLVSDELHAACSAKGKKLGGTSLRAGVTHYLAGMVRCGACGGTMRLQHCPGRKGPGLQCRTCAEKKSAGLSVEAPYASTVGLDLAVRDAVAQSLTPEVADLFRARLTARLTGGVDAELAQHRVQLDRNAGALARLARLLASLDRDDVILETQYKRLLDEKDELGRRVVQLTSSAPKFDKAALQKQLAFNPSRLMSRVFAGDPAALSARLRRFFQSIVLEGKPSKSTAIFALSVVPGAIASELTGTPALDATPVLLRYEVKQRRHYGGTVSWEIRRLPAQ